MGMKAPKYRAVNSDGWWRVERRTWMGGWVATHHGGMSEESVQRTLDNLAHPKIIYPKPDSQE